MRASVRAGQEGLYMKMSVDIFLAPDMPALQLQGGGVSGEPLMSPDLLLTASLIGCVFI